MALVNKEELESLLADLAFESEKISKAVVELKKIDDLRDIQKKLEGIKDIKIDTSKFEEEFAKEVESLNNKMISISSKVDFNELDEIQVKLRDIEKSSKPYKILSMLFITSFAFAFGYLLNVYKPIPPVTKEGRVVEALKKEGMKIDIAKDGRKYILFPKNIERKSLQNGQIVFIKKETKK